MTAAAGTYVPVAVGAILGALGSLAFIFRATTSDDRLRWRQSGSRRDRLLAVRSVMVVFALVAWICLILAIVLGEVAFIALTGVIALMAAGGLVYAWAWHADS
ncbi:MAG: hypothetical protein JSS97_02490 [Actinobacteria bacterium]|nr:hypothetical protein [Actinomycetota bacterium]